VSVAGTDSLYRLPQRMKASEARGPVFARGHQVDLLRQSDDFCMQVRATPLLCASALH
jgi:hypothetical protein